MTAREIQGIAVWWRMAVCAAVLFGAVAQSDRMFFRVKAVKD